VANDLECVRYDSRPGLYVDPAIIKQPPGSARMALPTSFQRSTQKVENVSACSAESDGSMRKMTASSRPALTRCTALAVVGKALKLGLVFAESDACSRQD